MIRPIQHSNIAPSNPGMMPLPQYSPTVPAPMPYLTNPGGIVQKKSTKPTIVKKRPKKRKMDEFEISDETISIVPESKLVKELQDFEKRLDMAISHKKTYMKHLVAQTTSLHYPLRIFVSHSVDEVTGHVTIHVQGGLMDENGTIIEVAKPFTWFLKRAFFEFESGLEIEPVEWNRPQGFKDVDGFSVTRKMNKDCLVKIVMLLREDPPRFYVSKSLGEMLNVATTQPFALNSILYAVWGYVKEQKLQDATDKKMVNCDGKLEEVLGVGKLSFTDLPSRIRLQLIPYENIEMEYQVRLNDDPKQTEVVYDIDVEIEEPSQSEISNFLLDEPSKEIMDLNALINSAVGKIQEHKKKREYYTQYSENPLQFIDKVIFSQTRDLQLMSPQLKEREEARFSSFYEQSWVDEALRRFLDKKEQSVSQQNTSQQQQ